MSKKLIRSSIAAAAVFGAVIAGGSTVASAQDTSTSVSSLTSTSTSASADSSTSTSASADASEGAAAEQSAPAGQGDQDKGEPHEHTDVTGDELTQVTDAVTAYDSAITVDKVQKDPDGSYDVMGTTDGSQTRLEVSADLQTITEDKGGPGGAGGPGGGGKGGHGGKHTEVTGDELTQVTNAVAVSDSSLTVEKAMKDEDGSYDVMATKDGSRIMLEVSADLQTVEERPAPPEGAGLKGAPDEQDQSDSDQSSSEPSDTDQNVADQSDTDQSDSTDEDSAAPSSGN